MGIAINFLNTQFLNSPITQSENPLKEKRLNSIFNSPFDRRHLDNQKQEVPKDGIFQIEDLTKLDDFCLINQNALEPLKKYDGQPWSKKIFNETAAYFLDNIEKLGLDKNPNELEEGTSIAGLLDKLCYKSIVLTNENKEKILKIADEYGWQLPKSFRESLNDELSEYFDYLADDFENNGMDRYAKEVYSITEDGEIIYEEK